MSACVEGHREPFRAVLNLHSRRWSVGRCPISLRAAVAERSFYRARRREGAPPDAPDKPQSRRRKRAVAHADAEGQGPIGYLLEARFGDGALHLVAREERLHAARQVVI